jgi:hypothetical protein
MLANIFQKTAKGLAAKGIGTYCPVKNELLVRNGRKTRRFVCENHEIRVVTPAGEESVFYCAPDATTRELKRFFAEMIAAMKQ